MAAVAKKVTFAAGGGLPGGPVGPPVAVEDIIRTAVDTNRIRLLDSFRDFDPLRSGFVTSKNFSKLDGLSTSLLRLLLVHFKKIQNNITHSCK